MSEKTLNVKLLLRNGLSAEWEASSRILGKGELAWASDTGVFKIGDGEKTWKEITRTYKDFESVQSAIDTAVAGLSKTHVTEINVSRGVDHQKHLPTGAAQGDIAIVREEISGDKKQYTAYVYTGSAWAAMDGNYDAENVYFQKDLTITAPIGVQTIPSTGSKTLSTTGKNIKQVFDMIVAEEKNPDTDQPTAVLNSSNIGSKEVGTNIAIAYSFVTNPGSYTYGPATGVTFSGYEATFNGETLTGASGTFASIQVTDSTNLSISGKCSSSEGAIPVTNLGNPYEAGKIAAKNYTPSKGTLTGFRGWFYGYYNGDQATTDPAAITSAQLRAFGTKTSFPSTMNTTKMQQMFFAAPKGRVSSVSISNAVNGAPLTVVKGTCSVEGANGYNAAEYDLFYVANAVAEGGDSKWNIVAK